LKLLAPTTFQEDFLTALDGLAVGSLYGALPQDPSLRASKWLPQVTADQVEAHVRQARKLGIGFIYAMNTRSAGGWEFTAEGQRWLVGRLGWLVDIGAQGVVTANPYLMELMKKRFPKLEVHVSTLADVDDVDKARFYEGLGADALYVPEYANRDVRFLKAVVQCVTCPVVLTVNLGCLARCPIRNYHTSCISESRESLEHGHFVDYSMMKCTLRKVQDPAEMLKGPWVRPEDLGLYEALGIKEFKIAGREQGVEWILRIIQAYSRRQYDGFLNDIIAGFDLVQPFGRLPTRIDNRKLEGFLPGVLKHDCHLGCLQCSYCDQWVAKAATVDEEARRRQAQYIEQTIARFTSGSFRAPLTSKTGSTASPR
jgi:collagenase-like PrtC family protease